jgi:hypothetical protein
VEPVTEDARKKLYADLACPFDPREIKWKPQMVKNNRAMAMAYIDARLVCDRLDDVLGVEGWKDSYQLLPDGSVQCLLSLRLFGEWVTKEDVGSQSEQPDGGDRLKAAFSDALKRAAVKFGVGRYLYRLPSQWVDYDPIKKQLVQIPALPDFAMPGASQSRGKAAPPGTGRAPAKQAPKPAPAPSPPPPPQQPAAEKPKALAGLPKTGEELDRRLREYDTKLAGQKVITAGELVKHVQREGVRAGYPEDLTKWSGDTQMLYAVTAAQEYEKQSRTLPTSAA